MTYRHAGLITDTDIQDLVWDDEAEAFCQERYSEAIPVPAKPAMCGCGARPVVQVGVEWFCETCKTNLVVCICCGHAGTKGDFSRRFDDEHIEMCPMCSEINTARRVTQ